MAGNFIDIGKGQPVLPGIIGAQHIREVGAVGGEAQISRIAIAIGVAGALKTLRRRGAAALTDGAHEIAEAFFVDASVHSVLVMVQVALRTRDAAWAGAMASAARTQALTTLETQRIRTSWSGKKLSPQADASQVMVDERLTPRRGGWRRRQTRRQGFQAFEAHIDADIAQLTVP